MRLSECAASASRACFREPVGEIGRDAVRAARTDAGEIRFATRRRHHRREPTTRDARDGEVRKFANGEIASRRGGDEEIDGEDRRERRRGDAERGEPEMRGAVTSKRVVACEMRKRTVHVDVVTRERGRRGGDDGHEQRFGDEIEQRASETNARTRESRDARRDASRIAETSDSKCDARSRSAAEAACAATVLCRSLVRFSYSFLAVPSRNPKRSLRHRRT